MKLKSAILISVFWVSYNFAGAQNIQNFTLTNTVNNDEVSLTNYSGKKGIVIIFTSNFCPYSKLYEDRIENLAAEYSGKGIQFLLINPNHPAASQDDSIEEMAKKAKAKGYQFPYLADKDQKVATMLGASKTPEAYVLKKSGNQFTVMYKGALDDNPQVANDVRSYYLKAAINAVLNDQTPATNHVRPTGCMIKRG